MKTKDKQSIAKNHLLRKMQAEFDAAEEATEKAKTETDEDTRAMLIRMAEGHIEKGKAAQREWKHVGRIGGEDD